jgi:hypothetical protein
MQDATEPKRGSSELPREWLICLGVPLAAASALFAAAVNVDDGPSWLPSLLFVPVLLLPMVWIGLLAFLAIASDTNGTAAAPAAEVVELEREPRVEPERLAA